MKYFACGFFLLTSKVQFAILLESGETTLDFDKPKSKRFGVSTYECLITLKETKEMDYYKRLEELKELAFLDESADYEVDYSGVYTDGSLFYYITASGCSCWSGDEGEWDEESFNDFESLRRFLLHEDLPRYNPSLNGAKALIEEAERNLGYR